MALPPFALGTRERAALGLAPGHRTIAVASDHRGEGVWHSEFGRAGPDRAGRAVLADTAFAPTTGRVRRVVVVSRGSGGNAARIGWLAGRTCAAGFIVVTRSHPGTMSRDSHPHRTPRIGERGGGVTAALDAVAMSDLGAGVTRVAAPGVSPGGRTASAAARVPKAASVACCERVPAGIDCVWMNEASVNFEGIDAVRYEADLRDPRVAAALPLAMTGARFGAIVVPALLVNLGRPEGVRGGMRLDAGAARMSGTTGISVPGAFHALAECGSLGAAVVALAGEDAIHSDRGGRGPAEVQAAVLVAIVPFLVDAPQAG